MKNHSCEICDKREARLFMVARQDAIVAKAHVCFICFELAQAKVPDTESVSLQDYNETTEARPLASP
jgi:hypothetical protein